MRRVATLLAAAAVSSAVTAAAIVLPAGADEGTRGDERTATSPPEERLEVRLSGTSSDERLDEFRACMKERGFDLSGPEILIEIRRDSVAINGMRVDRDAFSEARRACRDLIPRLPLALGELKRRALRENAPGEARERLERVRACMADAASAASD